MSFVLGALVRAARRRRDWGEAVWTAPDLLAGPILYTPITDEHCGLVTFGDATASEIGQQELKRL